MIYVLAAMTWLTKTTGIFFPFWLRLPAIIADAATVWLLTRIFAHRLNEPVIRWTLFLVAISPTLILVSGFHGNTDPVLMFFVLVSVWITQEDTGRKNPRDWASGMAFGAALCVKILPLMVLPVLFFARPGLRRRAIFLSSAAAVVLVCWSPYLFRDPYPVIRRVLGYHSIYGHWGLTWITSSLTFFRESWHLAFSRFGGPIVFVVIFTAAYKVSRRPQRPSVYTQTGAVLFFFLAAANGFGVQYLAWLVPWTVGVGIIPVMFFGLASGALLFVIYNYWSGGLPWFLADSNYVGDFTPHVDYLLTLCWISVIVLAIAVWKRTPVLPTLRTRILMTVLAIPAIAYPVWNQVARIDQRKYPPSEDRKALAGIHAHENAMLSEKYYTLGRYTEAVVAARTAIGLDATLVEAWNSLAKACLRLGRLDEADNAARTAIQLDPEDEAANANLQQLLSAGRMRQ